MHSDKGQVDFVFFEGAKLVTARHVKEIDRNPRMRPLKRCQGHGKQVVKQVGHVTDIEGSRFAMAQALNAPDDFVAQIDHAFGINQERAAFGREADVLFCAIQKPNMDFILEIFDLTCEGGLGEVKRSRKSGSLEYWPGRTVPSVPQTIARGRKIS